MKDCESLKSEARDRENRGSKDPISVSNCRILDRLAGLSASVSSSVVWGHDPSPTVLTRVATITQCEGYKSSLPTVRRWELRSLGVSGRDEARRDPEQSRWHRIQRLWEGCWLLLRVRREPWWGSEQ